MPVKVNNPRKAFQFTILIPGMNPFLCQKVKLPDAELDADEHGDTGFTVKTAGLKKLGMLTVDQIFDATDPSDAIIAWQLQIRNTQAGGGGDLPSNYKKVITVLQYAPDGVTAIAEYRYSGGWPQKRNGMQFDLAASGNTTRSIDFCVDEELF